MTSTPTGTDDPVRTVRFLVEGRVQGVGFRYHVGEAARQIGIDGWTRNRLDGSVEVLARASDDRLRRLEAVLRVGPPLAAVTSVLREEAAPAEEMTGFRIRA
jgi:acylphosphatase